MNLQKTIRRVLKEEFKKDILVDRYITSLINPSSGKYSHENQRFEINNGDNLAVVIFFNKRREMMEVMIDESLWRQIYEMFSMDGWDEINDYLVKWFQDNFDGLENLEEVTTFDNAEYAY